EALDQAGAAGQAAPGLDAFEPAVLEVALLDLAALELRQRGRHGLMAGTADLHPHREHVDEEAHHRLDPLHLAVPAGDDAAEDHVAAAGGASQESPPGALEHGVEGELMAAGQGRERLDLGRRQPAHLAAIAPAFTAQAGAVVGQRSGLVETGEGAAPVSLGALRVLTLQPGDVVAVAGRPLQRRLAAVAEGGVGRNGLAEDPGEGPAVDDEVVEAPDHLPGVLVPPDQGEAHQGRVAEIEAAVAVLAQEALQPRLALRPVQAAPVELLPGQLDLPADHLERLLPSLPDEES